MNRKHSKIAFLVGVCFLTGCSQKHTYLVTIERAPYEKLTYETAEVQKGDLEPSVTLTLKAEGYQQITYDATNEELQLDKVNVSVGDHVSKGQVLVSFQSEELQKTIEEQEESAKQKLLLAEHYSNLMKLDNSLDYQNDISDLQADAEVAKLYAQEAREKLSRYQLVAKEAGTITGMDSSLQNGIFVPGRRLITEVCGTGKYQTECPQGYTFQVGEIYTATTGTLSYELQVEQVSDANILFSPVSDMSSAANANTLNMTISKPPLIDVIYINTAAIHEVNNQYFVYLLNDNGYREAVSVIPGEQVGEYTVIADGLSVGEKVTLN